MGTIGKKAKSFALSVSFFTRHAFKRLMEAKLEAG